MVVQGWGFGDGIVEGEGIVVYEVCGDLVGVLVGSGVFVVQFNVVVYFIMIVGVGIFLFFIVGNLDVGEGFCVGGGFGVL